eukprot:scaffold366812_cov41-Attheya_sp.AAC.1
MTDLERLMKAQEFDQVMKLCKSFPPSGFGLMFWDALIRCNDSLSEDFVKRLLIECPTEWILDKDSCGNSWLHLACRESQPNPVVVKALLNAMKKSKKLDSLLEPNKIGSVPLHLACLSSSSTTVEVVKLLMARDPSALFKKDFACGRNPLHLVCGRISYSTSRHDNTIIFDLLQVLLSRPDVSADNGQSVPSRLVPCDALFMKDSFEMAPLDLAFSVLSKNLENSLLPFRGDVFEHEQSTTQLVMTGIQNKNVASQYDPSLIHAWNLLSLLLEGAYHRTVEQPQAKHSKERKQFQMLHACASLGPSVCPELFLRVILRMNGGQILERDSNGNIPLHLALASNGAKDPNMRSYTSELLRSCPDSAIVPDGSGRLSLHLAAKAGGLSWEGGAKALFHAAPFAVAVRDPVTGCFPFMLAACASETPTQHQNGEDTITNYDELFWRSNQPFERAPTPTSKRCKVNCNPQKNLNTSYELLRADPSVLTAFLQF